MRPVLYVDDNEDDVFFMRYAWEQLAIPNPLMELHDGQAAIDYFEGKGRFADRQKHPWPCLLLLDLNMPAKTGFEVLRWVRQHPTLKALPVVIVSGSNQPNDVETVQELGITDYLVKPSGPAKLVEALRAKKDVWLSGKCLDGE